MSLRGGIGPTSLAQVLETPEYSTCIQRRYTVLNQELGLGSGLKVTPQEGADEASVIHPCGPGPRMRKGISQGPHILPTPAWWTLPVLKDSRGPAFPGISGIPKRGNVPIAERLTERQRDILSYIKRTLDVEGVAPSMQEIEQEFSCAGRIRLRIGEVQGVPGAQVVFDDTGGASGPPSRSLAAGGSAGSTRPGRGPCKPTPGHGQSPTTAWRCENDLDKRVTGNATKACNDPSRP